MNEHDQYWEKEFASLAEEKSKPTSKERRKTSKIFFIILSTILITLVVGSVVTRIFIEQGALYWEPSNLIQGVSFFAFLYVMGVCFYLLESRGVLTESVSHSE